MFCPVCKETELRISDRSGVEIDYCPQCRGVWLDRGEIDKIIERSVQPENLRPAGVQQEYSQPPAPSYPPPRDPRYDHRRDYDYDDDDHYKHHKHRRKSFLEELFD